MDGNMSIYNKDVVPRRPKDVAPPGGLVYRRYTKETPVLVVESYPIFGNKFHDNTAPYWYWVYVIHDGTTGVPVKQYAENYWIFDAR